MEHPVALTDLFKIGIGPSSSHTIGPMRAAALFMEGLSGLLDRVEQLSATAYGSLAWTGRGHATDKAMILGLAGFMPDSLDPDLAEQQFVQMTSEKRLRLASGRWISFDPQQDVVFDTVNLFARHPNAMTFQACDGSGNVLASEHWFSIGGGFVEREGAMSDTTQLVQPLPYPYRTGEELLALGQASTLSIAEMVRANEAMRSGPGVVEAAIARLADVMFACIERGLAREGELPGGLKVKRRAKGIHDRLEAAQRSNVRAPHEAMNFVSAYAIAVNEENASGGRVVTAPTNGAAGVVPAVLRYYRDFCPGSDTAGIEAYFLTATAIGGLIKRNASISGAEVGCQGEVGSAAAMAAAGLAAALGGSNEQVENAAEIAMEHHLGMTCDPIGGLVQIPCIERNAFGAIKAINAASLALHEDGVHKVSLDQVVETMRQTGADMQSKYRETSRGGLAVNVPEC
jgi:L-serine dehydratase